MKKTLRIFGLIALTLIFSEVKAQISVTPKDITDSAAQAVLDKENTVTASGAGINGKFTPVKLSAGEKEDLKKGFYAGVLELDVKGDYGNFKTGKFNLYFKEGKQGLRLYLEEKGAISGVFEVTQTTPENYKETKTSDQTGLAFPEFSEEKQSQNFAASLNPAISAFASVGLLRRCKIYIKIIFNRHGYWVWSGATRECGKPAR